MTYKDLCNFAHSFPRETAEFLEVGSSFKRNVREETITDLLMCGLKKFEHLGIRVDFPEDESKTGQDMDWEFVAPHALKGKKYIRLHIQAKRAKLNPISKPYWWYPEIDHASPKGAQRGTQHESLVQNAKVATGCIPLYMFYHPQSALKPKRSGLPEVEGVNIMPANAINVLVTKSVWPRKKKKVETFRSNFSPLSILLCHISGRRFVKNAPMNMSVDYLNSLIPTPKDIVDALNSRYSYLKEKHELIFETSDQIPERTLLALAKDGAASVERPRAIFHNRSKFSEGAEYLRNTRG